LSLRAEGVAISAGREIASSSLTPFEIPRNDRKGCHRGEPKLRAKRGNQGVAIQKSLLSLDGRGIR